VVKVAIINVAFTRPYNLKSHYRGHLGEKPFVCDIPGCGASFARKHDLKRHILSHSYSIFILGKRRNLNA
jgi:uncharacterized Zn-finger protein